MTTISVTQILVKIKHNTGEAVLQLEEIVDFDFSYNCILNVTTKYGERSFTTTRETYDDLFVKYKKYKEEMKSLILAQLNNMEMLAE